ncbi:unnamed protein product [Adineta ricciae]|uniref:G-protein coupled receptors family 1 profile domain-containing protein n=1 Tax=Adineta ricciae TaxID=249248 RepID=A0A814NNJ6_ADIRI|nr:unnamed protein product [Adineta ricciae]
MVNLNETFSTDNSTSSSSYSISPLFRFWSYLVLDTLSVVCTLITLCFLLLDKAIHKALHNHIIIVLLVIDLIYELTDIPWILYFNYWGVPMFASTTFYIIWTFVDYAFYSTQIALFAWATIERHILIFHDKWIATKRKRLFVHYIPIIAITSYCLLFYTFIYLIPFCKNSFDSFVGGGIYIPCLFSRTILGSWDLIVQQVIPTSIIVIFSALLILRVIWQKKRLHQPIAWKRHRKMTIQLISISCLYILFNLPWTFLVFAFQYGLSAEVAEIPLLFAGYLYYYVTFFFPFVCLGSLPEIRKKLAEKLCWCRRRRRTPKEVSSKVVTSRIAASNL